MNQDENSSKKKTHLIGFRVAKDAYDEIENRAVLAGKSTNDWCRDELLARLDEGGTLTANEELIHSEIIRYGGVLGIFLDLILRQELTPEKSGELLRHLNRERKEMYKSYFTRNIKEAHEEGK